VGTSEPCENYEGHFAEEYPCKHFWENRDRFWVERYRSGAGIFVQRDPNGRWRVHRVNGGMRDVDHPWYKGPTNGSE
jgi:hypothetical protein